MLRKWLLMAVVSAVGVGLISLCGSAWAQKTKGKTRAAATKYLMRGIQQAHCKALGDMLKEAGPADDKAWDTAACHASCLNEMSYLLMDDGRCPDAVWKGATNDLRDGSAAVLAAIEKKDLEGTRTAFKTVIGSCGTCHKAHKN
jgi:cytochrome c556